MKRFLSIVMVAILSFTLVGCGNGPTPTETSDTFMQAIKNIDWDSFVSVYEDASENEKLLNLSDEDRQILDDIKASNMAKMFDVSYEISNEKIDGDTATVDIKMTTYNIEKLFQAILPQLMQLSVNVNTADMDEDELFEEVMKLTESKMGTLKSKNFTTTATIKLIQKDGEWKVASLTNNKKFINGITGGLLDLVENINDYF